MKKTALTIAGAAAVAGIAAGLLVWNRGGAAAPLAAAQMLPAETLLLAEAPDCRGSMARWPRTALAQLLNEPETVAFLEHPLSRCPMRGVWSNVLERLSQAEVRQGFFALTDIVDNMPHVVCGLAFRPTRRGSMEAIVTQIRAQALAANPSGKSAVIKHRGCEIETFAARNVVVAGVFAGDWYFFGNDVKLLEETLDRFAGMRNAGSGIPRRLSDDPAYSACEAHLPAWADLRFYAKAGAFAEKLLTLSGVDPSQTEWLRKVEAVAGATRMTGLRMHDRIFVLQPGGVQLPGLTRSTLRLTSPNTLFYYAFAPVIPASLPSAQGTPAASSALGAGPLQGLLWGARGFALSLADQGIRVEDFKAAFGPEFAASLDWPASPPGSTGTDEAAPPVFQLAGQVRAAAAARKFTEAFCANWQQEQTNDLTLWRWPIGEPGSTPVIGLTDPFLLAGLSADSLRACAARLKKGGATLADCKAFTDALATVAPPGNTLVYLNTQALFERVYDEFCAMAAIWTTFVPHAGDYVQIKSLPRCEVVSKHLLPIVLTAKQAADGTVLESSGPITLFQTAMALGGITSAAAVPVIEGKATVPRVDTLIETLLSLSRMQERKP